MTGYLSAEVNGGSTAAPSTPSTTALNSPNQTTKSIGDLTMAAKGGQQVCQRIFITIFKPVVQRRPRIGYKKLEGS